MTRDIDILIAGAGPTGLGAAWRLDALGHTEWLVCEASDEAGGLASSVVDSDGFTWDLGGHVQFSHYPYFDDLMDELLGPDGWLYHQRESWVWLLDRFVPYPFQLNLHRLPEADTQVCVRGLISAACGADAARVEPSHFADWITASFGTGIADLFLRPYNRKVWAYPLESLASDWTGDRVARVDLPRLVRNLATGSDDVAWGPNNEFRFPRRGGTGAIWRALAARLERRHPGRFLRRSRIARVDAAAHQVHFESGDTIRYRYLISTMPLDELIRISDFAGALGPAAGELRYSSTHVVGIALTGAPPADLRGKCWIYFPENNCPFYRVTVFSHYSPNNVPDPSRFWSLMAEVSESSEKPVDRSRVVVDTVDGLLATGLARTRAQVHHTWHRHLEHGYPTPTRTRDCALKIIHPSLEASQIYSRGRFGAWKYEVSNQDHSFAQGVECVDRIISGRVEDTLHHPDAVNARRSRPRRFAERVLS